MPLNPQLKSQMVYFFPQLVKDAAEVDTLLDLASITINTNVKNFQGSTTAMWNTVISETDANDQVDVLLKALTERHPNNDTLKSISKEFKSGTNIRMIQLARAIQNNQCVLFLGPGAILCNDGREIRPFSNVFASRLEVELRKNKIPYDEYLKNDVKYVAQRYKNLPTYIFGDLGREAKKLFDQLIATNQVNKVVFENLKRLSFPLVINTNPDKILFEELTEQNAAARYYDLSNTARVNEKETAEDGNYKFWQDKTLIYNIFGSFDNPLSIHFTEASFVSFTKAVFQNNPPLFRNVIQEFDETKYYLFLGFEFNAWYLKILLEVLYLVRKEPRAMSLYIDNPLPDHIIEYYHREFNFFFFNDDINSFTTRLVSEVEKLKNPIQP